MLRSVTAGSILLLSALGGCTTPGLYATLPQSKLTELRKVVVISVLGDKIGYHRQGLISGDRAETNIAAWGLDEAVVDQSSRAIANALGVQVVAQAKGTESFFLLYNGRAAPGNSGLEFERVKPELRRIIASSGADTAVLIFKGIQGLPGGHRYWVQGSSVSRMHGYCALFPVIMIGILDLQTMEPVAANYLAPAGPKNQIQLPAPAPLPEELCERQLQNLSAPQNALLKAAFLSFFSNGNVHASIKRLIAP